MICIADSGSTKTDWVVVDPATGKERHFHSIGLNPFFVSSHQVRQALEQSIDSGILHQIKNLYFYGAGCSSDARRAVIATGAAEVLPQAQMHIEHDLMAAARATCQHSEGIACILGTGSNSCYFDGTTIKDNVTSLGYILGDEGSGGMLGKSLIQAWVYRELPPELSKALVEEYELTKEDVLTSTYNEPLPNRYLASFAPFLSKHNTHPFVADLIKRVMDEFIKRHVLKYERSRDLPIQFVGSIATAFRTELEATLQLHQLQPGNFIVKPIDHLVRYHSAQE